MITAGVSSATAMRIARYHAQALQAIDTSAARIAAGRRFTSFAEDTVAATSEISLRAQQGAVGLYLRATQDAASAADAASDGLQSASDILIELRTAVLALNTSDADSITSTQETVAALTEELTRIGATTTTAGGKSLLDGSIASTPLTFTVAGSGTASDEVDLNAIAVDASQLGSASLKLDAIDFTAGAPTSQSDALDAIDAAQSAVTASLASTGAVSSAMGYHATAVGDQVSSVDAALDNLVGLDVAQETATMTANQIRAEATAAILAQVNALHVSMVRQLLLPQ